MNEARQIDIKVFAEQGADITPYAFVPVLQRWIQEHTVPGVLIDVADYSHIHHGAGIVLVAHEYNLSIDYADGRMGLLFHDKRPTEKPLETRMAAALNQAFHAAALLEQEPEFQARLSFDRSRFQFLISDRLLAPNTDDTYDRIAPLLKGATSKLSDGEVVLTRVNPDPRNRLAIDVTTAEAIEVSAVA